MNFPSLDQSWRNFRSVVFNKSSSLPALLADFTYKFPVPSRSLTNAIRLPSGDQIGIESSAGSNVNRVGALRAMSSSQTSRLPLCESVMDAAIRFSSGDRYILEKLPVGPRAPRDFPSRSNK